MKKLLVTTLVLLLFLSTYAQTLIGGQVPVQLKVTSYGSTQNALVSLPDDYNQTTGVYPLIVFLHGLGEIGSTTTDLNKLLNQGLPAVIAKGIKIQATNPVDKKLYKFIVLSIQHFGWTTPPENLYYILNNIRSTYRVDTNRIYVTGLSAGGQGVIQALTYSQDLTSKIAAVVPMSPSAPDNSVLKNFRFAAKTAAWFFSGASDPGNYTANAKRYNDSINKYNPGNSRITLFPGGHCCWVTYYNPDYRENGKNIYEWMLTYTKGKGGTIPDTPVFDPQICIGQAGSIRKVIVLMKDGSFKELDSTSFIIPNVQLDIH